MVIYGNYYSFNNVDKFKFNRVEENIESRSLEHSLKWKYSVNNTVML